MRVVLPLGRDSTSVVMSLEHDGKVPDWYRIGSTLLTSHTSDLSAYSLGKRASLCERVRKFY